MSTEPEEKAFFYFLFARLFREAPDLSLLREIVEKNLLRTPNKTSVILSPSRVILSGASALRTGSAKDLTLRFFGLRPQNDVLLSVLSLARDFFDDSKEKEFLEDPKWPERIEEIAVEHTSLFILSRESYIPPYESYYCDTLTIDSSTACSPYFQREPFPTGMKGFLGGPSATAVQKIYQEKGFSLSSDFHDLPDHVACELEFMGRLWERGEVEAAESFFKDHLGRWIFIFLDRVSKQNHSIFYQKVASSLADFLKEEHRVEVRLS